VVENRPEMGLGGLLWVMVVHQAPVQSSFAPRLIPPSHWDPPLCPPGGGGPWRRPGLRGPVPVDGGAGQPGLPGRARPPAVGVLERRNRRALKRSHLFVHPSTHVQTHSVNSAVIFLSPSSQPYYSFTCP